MLVLSPSLYQYQPSDARVSKADWHATSVTLCCRNELRLGVQSVIHHTVRFEVSRLESPHSCAHDTSYSKFHRPYSAHTRSFSSNQCQISTADRPGVRWSSPGSADVPVSDDCRCQPHFHAGRLPIFIIIHWVCMASLGSWNSQSVSAVREHIFSGFQLMISGILNILASSHIRNIDRHLFSGACNHIHLSISFSIIVWFTCTNVIGCHYYWTVDYIICDVYHPAVKQAALIYSEILRTHWLYAFHIHRPTTNLQQILSWVLFPTVYNDTKPQNLLDVRGNCRPSQQHRCHISAIDNVDLLYCYLFHLLHALCPLAVTNIEINSCVLTSIVNEASPCLC